MKKSKSPLLFVLVSILVIAGIWIALPRRSTSEPATSEPAKPVMSAPIEETKTSKAQNAESKVASSSSSSPSDSLKKAPQPGASSNSGEPMTAREFEELVRSGINRLAHQASARESVAKDPHGMPPVLIQSGLLLGRIAEAVSKNPALEARAVEFYSECATSDQLAHSVRALCLARFRSHSGQALPKNAGSSIPESIQKLATQAGL